jgi:hypothetical protein
MRLLTFVLVVVAAGCGDKADPPEEVVRSYLQAGGPAACQYLTAAQAKLCRRPRVPEPPADGIVIERVRVRGERATIGASYNWTAYRRHSTFALVRRDDDWLIAQETPDA